MDRTPLLGSDASEQPVPREAPRFRLPVRNRVRAPAPCVHVATSMRRQVSNGNSSISLHPYSKSYRGEVARLAGISIFGAASATARPKQDRRTFARLARKFGRTDPRPSATYVPDPGRPRMNPSASNCSYARTTTVRETSRCSASSLVDGRRSLLFISSCRIACRNHR